MALAAARRGAHVRSRRRARAERWDGALNRGSYDDQGSVAGIELSLGIRGSCGERSAPSRHVAEGVGRRAGSTASGADDAGIEQDDEYMAVATGAVPLERLRHPEGIVKVRSPGDVPDA